MYDFSAIMKVNRKDLRHEVELADLHGLLQNTVACCLTGTPQLQRWLKQEWVSKTFETVVTDLAP